MKQAESEQVCRVGFALTLEAIEELTRAVSHGSQISLNGMPFTEADLALLAARVKEGAVFCLLKPKVEEQANSLIEDQTMRQTRGLSARGDE